MSETPSKYTPTVKQQTGLKVQIQNTAEGRAFLEQLKAMLGHKELPFVQSCPPTDSKAAASAEEGGSTSYTLDLRLEQEGFPP